MTMLILIKLLHLQQRKEEEMCMWAGHRNTAHMLQCSFLSHHCTLDDLLKFNDIGKECVEQWKKRV